VDSVVRTLDAAAGAILWPLAVWILLSGLDDLFVLFVFLARGGRREADPLPEQLDTLPQKRIAIFVPLWHEHAVIRRMLEHNLAAIRYSSYDFFVGAYPNDGPTREAVAQAATDFPRVHLCVCPHDGPTSKADCLNWIYQHMLLYEERQGVSYDAVMTHDAEDIIHPDSLLWVNWYLDRCDMVQTPVLALPTPFRELTHGLYCDDFAEYHTKDMVAREVLGGFIPSSGVGAGYSRTAIETLAASESNRLFEPGCLTEDYENGLRIAALGMKQRFARIRFSEGKPVATREYFPRTFRSARRQRTRWITGIALQGWQRHGWSAEGRHLYWLWRDRKGLIANPASMAANLLFAYGAATWAASAILGRPWSLGQVAFSGALAVVMAATLTLGLIHLAARGWAGSRIYGWRFALGSPLRLVYGNCLNTVATVDAVRRFLWARIQRRPLVWVKTEHAYPSGAALRSHKRPLAEILAERGFVTASGLQDLLDLKPAGLDSGEYLVARGAITEEQLYEALSIQQSLPVRTVDPQEVPASVARALPAHLMRQWRVLPFRVAKGSLYLASPDPPTEELEGELRRFTHLEIRFHLVTPTNFRELERTLLPAPVARAAGAGE
jgi:adsorption protein B